MKNIISKIAASAVLVGSVLGVSSCNELDLYNPNEYTPETFWSNKGEFENYMIAMQEMFRANYTQQITFDAGEVRAGALFLGELPDGSGTANETYIQNQYTEAHYQIANFGNWFGFIANLNEHIYRIENQDGILDENTADGLLAIDYGWRAFAYFQMWRMWGGVPLRLEPDVTLGEYTPSKLYKARATAEETLTQIKSDIAKSLELFGKSTYVFQSGTKAYMWNKAATELLAGQVYLWSGKVDQADHKATGEGDIRTAKNYFSNVINNYGYELLPDFFDVFKTPLNKENIFSVCYSSMSDKSWYNLPQNNFNWSPNTGGAIGKFWTLWNRGGYNGENVANTFEKGDFKQSKDTLSVFGFFPTVPSGDQPFDEKTVTDVRAWYYTNLSQGVQRYQFKNALFFQFDENDQRREAFFPLYGRTDREAAMNTRMLVNVDPTERTIRGNFVIKFRQSQVDEKTQYWQCIIDMPIYRLPDAYLGLAECANYLGEKADMESAMNALRKRAYAGNWDENTYGFKYSSNFVDNESAIMREVDKEFFLEGRRWWYLRSLSTVKGGSQLDHFVFQPQGCVGYGLPVDTKTYMIENDGTPCAANEAVLQGDWAYRLLWPIDNGLLGSDPEIKQNPGYGTGE